MSNEGNTLLKDGIVNGVLRSYDVFVMSWWDIPVGFPDGPSAPPRIHPKHNLTFHSVWQAFRPTRYTKTVTCWARLSRALASPRPWSPWRWRPAPNSFLTAPLAKAMTRSRQKKQFLALLWIILTVTILVVHIYREIIYSVIRLFVSLIFMHWLIRSFIQSCINSVLH